MAITLIAPFTLIGSNGDTVVFGDLETLAVYCRNARIMIGPAHVYEMNLFDSVKDGVHYCSRLNPSWSSIRYYDWIVRDLMGRRVLERDLPARAHRPYRGEWDELKWEAEARGLPIPGTGRSHKRYWKSHYRRMRFVAVWRASEAAVQHDRDEGVRVNGRLHRAVPPNSWDDYRRGGSVYDRSWKRNRKTRWREPAVSWRVVREDG